ncbi:hypothetical protein ACI77O_12535 [Pseudomonas tritici]|uniref:hypothetical protein n=1 Tax=Pseudomonas tritici TaxID=2745518 RepID=UPI00387B6DB2
MSKQINAVELAEIVSSLLTGPQNVGQLTDTASQARFMTEIATVVANFYGGEVQNPADDFTGEFLVGIHGNDSVPEDGGIWANYDIEGDLFN